MSGMTAEERAWKFWMSGEWHGTIEHGTRVLAEAIRAAETEAEQRGAEREREACAVIIEDWPSVQFSDGPCVADIARRIRERGSDV